MAVPTWQELMEEKGYDVNDKEAVDSFFDYDDELDEAIAFAEGIPLDSEEFDFIHMRKCAPLGQTFINARGEPIDNSRIIDDWRNSSRHPAREEPLIKKATRDVKSPAGRKSKSKKTRRKRKN